MARGEAPRPAARTRRPVLFVSFLSLLLMAALYFGHAFVIVSRHEEPQRRHAATAAATTAVVSEAAAAAAASFGLLEPTDEAPEAAAAAAESAGLAADAEAERKRLDEQARAHAATQRQRAAEAVQQAEAAKLAKAAELARAALPAPVAEAAGQSAAGAGATLPGADPKLQLVAGECPPGRRPYHVVMTAATGVYQEWQSRIAYYHYLKQKRLNPCSDLGGFTRLFNTPNAQPDSMMDEMPTLLVKQLGHGRCAECDHGFIVMNRPWGVVQMVQSAH